MRLILAQPAAAIANFVAEKVGLPLNSWHNYSTLGLAGAKGLYAGVVYSQWSSSDCMTTIGADSGARWMTPEFLFAIHDYPFTQIGVRRLNAVVRRSNVISQNFIQNLGFQLEGCVREAYEDEDGYLYGMLKKDCRWITPNFRSLLQRRNLRRLPVTSLAAA